MSLANELALFESERNQLKHENESLKTRLAKNAGALDESRAQNRQLIDRNEKLAAQCARYDKHFRDALGSAEHIVKARDELAPVLPGVPEPKTPEAPNSILGKLTRLGLRTEVAA